MNHLEKRIKQMFPKEDIEVLIYTKMQEPTILRCKQCKKEYEFKKAENAVRVGKKCICSQCVNNGTGGRLTLEQFQEKINKLYPEEDLTVLEYTLKNRPCSIRCNNCGEIFTLQNAESFYNKNKKRVCKNCLPNKRRIIQESINKFLDWEKNQQNFRFEKLPQKINSKTLIPAYCNECRQITYKTIYDYLRGRGCGFCQKNVLKTKNEIQQEIGEEYTVLEYKGMDHRSKFKHNLCNFIYDANPRHFSCPRCKGSKGQKKIRFLLTKSNIKFEEQKVFNIKGHKLRVDFYLVDYDIVIEYQGQQHFHPIEYFGGEEVFKKQCLYDNYKKQFFKSKMIEISYLDYDILDKKINDLLKNLKSSSTIS